MYVDLGGKLFSHQAPSPQRSERWFGRHCSSSGNDLQHKCAVSMRIRKIMDPREEGCCENAKGAPPEPILRKLYSHNYIASSPVQENRYRGYSGPLSLTFFPEPEHAILLATSHSVCMRCHELHLFKRSRAPQLKLGLATNEPDAGDTMTD